ncbi:unnamed protein product, partial [Callosobruchus maculatus]
KNDLASVGIPVSDRSFGLARQICQSYLHAIKSMSSSSGDDFNALESVFTKLKRKKVGIHTFSRERTKYGEYHHLFQSLKNDNQIFFQYTRMT